MVATSRNVSVVDALELIEAGAFVLDVRELDEFEAGHVAQAVNVPLAEVPDHLDELPRDRVIVCLCRSGSRSGRAAAYLDETGFETLNVEGGMIAWDMEGQPLVAQHGAPTVM